MGRTLRTCAAGLGAVIGAGLGGCASPFEVGVENAASRPIEVEMIYDPLLDRQVILGQAVLHPGERTSLGPYELDPLNPVYVSVRPTGDPLDVAERLRVSQGLREFVVEDGGIGHWHALTLRELKDPGVPVSRRPAPWPEAPRR